MTWWQRLLAYLRPAQPRQPVGIGFPIARGPGAPVSGPIQPRQEPRQPVSIGFPIARQYGGGTPEPGLPYVLQHYGETIGGHTYNIFDLARLAREGFRPPSPVAVRTAMDRSQAPTTQRPAGTHPDVAPPPAVTYGG
ncbi:MAG: hypothetical protein KGK07_13525 [Chloroflexota bacterium]|nr:hypothetical protein [Chloroflexota bacterium]